MLSLGIPMNQKLQSFKRDKWTWKKGVGTVSKDLISSFHGVGNYFIGLSEAEGFINVLRWGLENSNKNFDHRYYTYSLLFYLNFNGMLNFLKEIEDKKLAQHAILFVNHAAKEQESRFKQHFSKIYYFFDDGPNNYDKNKEIIISQAISIARAHQNSIFLISGGPVAKILISEMWKASKCNQYVDFGSGLDFYTKRKQFPTKLEPTHRPKRWKFVKEIDNFHLKENTPNAKVIVHKTK
eukprot:gene6025-10027_t